MFEENNDEKTTNETNKSSNPNILELLVNKQYNSIVFYMSSHISKICQTIDDLKDYSLRMGAKSDSSIKTKKM